jgi:hypothetical protein
MKWTVSHRRRLVFVVAKGEVTALDMLSFVGSLDDHKALTYRKLFDITGLTMPSSPERIATFATIIKERQGAAAPVAVVVGDSAHLHRQATAFAGAIGAARTIKIFRERGDAEDWLDRHLQTLP